MPDSTMIASPVGTCATDRRAPAYLARAGTPQTPQDLRHTNASLWVSLQLSKGQETAGQRCRLPLHANNGGLLAQAAEAGCGIALLRTFIVEDALKAAGAWCHALRMAGAAITINSQMRRAAKDPRIH